MAYNGWKNYETWNVALWVGNDEHLYRAMRAGAPYTAETIREFVAGAIPRGTPDFADRGRARAYVAVDWQAIADMANER
jgi:hypothetical protein